MTLALGAVGLVIASTSVHAQTEDLPPPPPGYDPVVPEKIEAVSGRTHQYFTRLQWVY
jgi:hypothetical protein